ncbi:MAG: hypothetical protein GXP62_10705, partial [Oligoflexia bacterium]|nr:hypothetical protein [Oligoflexia bacterium]
MLRLIQDQLQAVYRTDAPDVRDYLMDRDAVEAMLGQDARPADEWVLVRQDGDVLDLGVYIHADHLATLSGASGLAAAAHDSFRAFCAAIEGVSH